SIFEAVAGGEQQNRRGDALLADRGQDLKAVAAGKHDIQEDDVELLGGDAEECVLAGMRDNGFVPFVLETFFQRVGDFDFIFDNKNTHGTYGSSVGAVYDRAYFVDSGKNARS